MTMTLMQLGQDPLLKDNWIQFYLYSTFYNKLFLGAWPGKGQEWETDRTERVKREGKEREKEIKQVQPHQI